MPKKRRLLNTLSSAEKMKVKHEHREGEVWTARGRLKGALMEVLEPTAEDSDSSSDRESQHSRTEQNGARSRSVSPPRQAYVLKLFDRSVDLAQFQEDTPLYPICRAWIRNQPKTTYSQSGQREASVVPEDAVTLPGPEGEPVSRIPPLLPEQRASRENINLDYRAQGEGALPSRSRLLQGHARRWGSVRDAWQQHARRCEARHAAAQNVLNRLHVNTA